MPEVLSTSLEQPALLGSKDRGKPTARSIRDPRIAREGLARSPRVASRPETARLSGGKNSKAPECLATSPVCALLPFVTCELVPFRAKKYSGCPSKFVPNWRTEFEQWRSDHQGSEGMGLVKYDCNWVGIDAGREGLWKEPIWTDVLRIVSEHENEHVYDSNSPVYDALEARFPKEAWRSKTADGTFRPLFRDYPNSWTRTGVVSLAGQVFRVTDLGRQVLAGSISKADLLTRMFIRHSEVGDDGVQIERPFATLASAFLVAPWALSADEVYWAVMKNYRPGHDDLLVVLRKKLPLLKQKPAPTPLRRLRNMLALMRSADALASTRRSNGTAWFAFNQVRLNQIAQGTLR